MQLQASRLVEFIFNSMIHSMLKVDPDGSMKHSLLLVAILHASIMNECRCILEDIPPGLLAMVCQLRKFEFDTIGLRYRRQLTERVTGTPHMSNDILKMVEQIEIKNNLITCKGERAEPVERDELVRETLKLAFHLIQRDEASKYEDIVRLLMKEVKMVRPATTREYYKQIIVKPSVPSAQDIHELTLSVTTSWEVFLRQICQECESDDQTKRFFMEFPTLLNCDSHVDKKIIKRFVKNLINSPRTILRLFDGTLLTNARARNNPFSLVGLAMPMFDFLRQPT